MVRHGGCISLMMGLVVLAIAIISVPQVSGTADEVIIIELEGAIGPASAAFLSRGLKDAEDRNAALAVVRLDTPGGLASSMRSMVKSIMIISTLLDSEIDLSYNSIQVSPSVALRVSYPNF